VCDSECKAHSEAWQARREIEATNEAFDFLYGELREAKRRFEAGNDAGRDGVIHALETIVKFLGLYEPVLTGGLHAPLAMLFDALMHLDDGDVLPMLQKVPHSGRARASAGRESLMGMVAYTVDALCATGMPLDDARETVACELQRAGVRPGRGRGEFTSRTVRTWCEKVAADVGARGEAKQTYALLEKKFGAEGGTKDKDPESIRSDLLKRLSDVCSETRAGEKPT
jgi:hypothetical protein